VITLATPSSAELPSTKSMFGRDSIYVAVSTLPLISAIAVTPAVARVLNVTQFGRFAAALALWQALVSLFSLGMIAGVQRLFFQHGRDAAQQLLTVSSVLAIALCAVVFATSRLWAQAIGFSAAYFDVRLIVVWGLVGALTQVAIFTLRALDRLGAYATVYTLQASLSQAVGLAWALTHARTATDVIFGCAAIQGLALAIAWIAFRPKMVQRQSVGVLTVALRFSIAIVPLELGYFAISAIDRLMIQHYLGPAAVARYQLAYNLGSVGILLSAYFHQVWESRVFQHKTQLDRTQITASSRDQLLVLFGFVMMGIGIGGPSALYLWAPHSYNTGQLTFVVGVMALCVLPHCVGLARSRVILGEGRPALTTYATVGAAGLNTGLNIVLIPRMGLDGAAISVFLCLVFRDIVLRVLSAKTAPLPRIYPGVRAFLVASSLVVLLWTVLPTRGDWFWVRAAVAIAPTLAAGYFLRYFARENASLPTWVMRNRGAHVRRDYGDPWT
jgi:O-antigen/teichoic acid export membrane protein